MHALIFDKTWKCSFSVIAQERLSITLYPVAHIKQKYRTSIFSRKQFNFYLYKLEINIEETK